MSSKVCAKCDHGILRSWVVFEEKFYHDECFTCASCGRVINVKESFNKVDDEPVCGECNTNKFTARCDVCEDPIKGQRLIYDNKNYHFSCKSCNKCEKPFEEGEVDQIKVYEGKIFVHAAC